MLRLLIDESINGNVARGLIRRLSSPSVLRVQEAGLRTQDDRVILEFAAMYSYVVVTEDRKTMIRFAHERVGAGQPMSGLLVLRPRITIGEAIDALVVAVECSTEADWKDRVLFWP
jgi:predicted nuclease of predicted toxin-antitoxin system